MTTKKSELPSKEERMKMAKKAGKSELEIYLEACKKIGRKPAASAVKRAAEVAKNAKKESK